ncbi:MAG: hypothetical protein MK102_16030 [Fuerstiella sp.]|nr:hypothetical protein [Fuerstiella sp.]
MLRTGIVTLVICIISTTDVGADEVVTSNNDTLVQLSTGNNAVQGQVSLHPVPVQTAPVLPSQMPQSVYRNSPGVYSTVSNGVVRAPVSSSHGISPGASGSKSGAPLSPGTALYPSPVPGIPQQMGGTAVSNQFLNPHEMLYPHHYRAMYPPYFYKVNGKYMVTPFGVWSHEDWNLQGTVVDVKYKSSISPFAMFQAPLRR